MASGYLWKPITPPDAPERLEVRELRPFSQLWAKQRERLKTLGALDAFIDRMGRWWSIETGVIERLYELSDGTTMAMVAQGFVASLIPHAESDQPQAIVQLLEDHQEALHMVMDLIGGTRPLSVGWIKELHALFTRNQEHTEGLTPDGRMVKVPLLRGAFKQLPNNPRRPDGLMHEYCPPEHVDAEMDRLVQCYGTIPPFLPEVRSAWLHHAFTQIHPFQDGNGRVARALASLDFIRCGLFPLLVRREDRDKRYLPALEQADGGDLGPLVALFSECVTNSLLQAISVAQDLVGKADSLHSVLQAARAKVRDRAENESDGRRIMEGRIRRLANEVRGTFQADYIPRIQASVPGIQAKAEVATASNEYWYRSQIVQVAKNRHYWADLHEARTWAKLRLRDGGNTDLVVSLHFAGNPSPGACMGVLFLVHSDRQVVDPAAPEVGRELVHLPIEPITLVSEEEEEEQRSRFHRWLERGVPQGLAQWAQYL